MYTNVFGQSSRFISEKKFGLIEEMVKEILSKRKKKYDSRDQIDFSGLNFSVQTTCINNYLIYNTESIVDLLLI